MFIPKSVLFPSFFISHSLLGFPQFHIVSILRSTYRHSCNGALTLSRGLSGANWDGWRLAGEDEPRVGSASSYRHYLC